MCTPIMCKCCSCVCSAVGALFRVNVSVIVLLCNTTLTSALVKTCLVTGHACADVKKRFKGLPRYITNVTVTVTACCVYDLSITGEVPYQHRLCRMWTTPRRTTKSWARTRICVSRIVFHRDSCEDCLKRRSLLCHRRPSSLSSTLALVAVQGQSCL